MKIKKIMTALLGAVSVLGLCQSSNAAPTQGIYTYEFSGDAKSNAWDISGTYNDIGLSGLIDGDFTISVDSKGKVTGSGDASFSENGVSLDMDLIVNGKVKKSRSALITTADLKITVKGKGNINFQGDKYRFTYSGSFKYNLKINQTENNMSGRINGGLLLAVKGLGTERISVKDINNGEPISFSADLPDQMDGSWTVAMPLSVNAKGKPVVGEVTITLSNGRQLLMSGQASYRPTSDITKIKLRGSNPASKGCKLEIVVEGANLDIKSQKGILLGQKLR